MRPIAVIAALVLPGHLPAAEALPPMPSVAEETPEFQLGGATSRAALVPDIDITEEEEAPRPRLTLPLPTPDSPQQSTTFGPATLFMGEQLDAGRDAVRLGTFLSRGQARAGVSVTYLEEEEEVSRSEVFLDYSLTEQFSVGLSGILNSEIDEAEAVPQLGVNAEFTTEDGAYLRGGIADAAEYEPVFGLSIGFRF